MHDKEKIKRILDTFAIYIGNIALAFVSFIITLEITLAFKIKSKFNGTHQLWGSYVTQSRFGHTCVQVSCWTKSSGISSGMCVTTINHVNRVSKTYLFRTLINNRLCSRIYLGQKTTNVD